VLLLSLSLHREKLGKGQAEASEQADVEESTAGEVIGKGISGAAFFHSFTM